MLIIKNLDKSFEDKPILNDANLVINKGEKIALIGSNGTGKTTLLRLILEFDDDFYGNIENTFKTISYMTQDLDLRNQNKLFNEAVLFDNRLVASVLDLYSLEFSQVIELERMADKSARNL